MKNKNKVPVYLKHLIEKYPKIFSGRKNFEQHHKRIIKTLKLIEKFYKKNDYKNL